MKTRPSRRRLAGKKWPRKVRLGSVSVSLYRHGTPLRNPGFMVVNYAKRKRRFDCCPTAEEALAAAEDLARTTSQRGRLKLATVTR